MGNHQMNTNRIIKFNTLCGKRMRRKIERLIELTFGPRYSTLWKFNPPCGGILDNGMVVFSTSRETQISPNNPVQPEVLSTAWSFFDRDGRINI